MILRAFSAAFLLLVLAAPSRADEVLLADGRKLVGRILEQDDEKVTVLTYKDGPITAAASEIKLAKKSSNLYDGYDQKKGEFEETAEGRFKLGEWCKGQGLGWQAREEWKKAVELDPALESAHAALGDKKGKDGWTSFDEVQKSKGLEFFEGRWLKPADVERIQSARHPTVGWVLTAAYTGDADAAFLTSWGERAKEASKFMWELTEGQMYVKEVTVTDKGGPADFTIINKDKMKIRDGVYAEAGADTISAPGQILAYTFFHELIHFKYARPDHCEKCRHCIMSSDPSANQICDDADHKAPPATSCWGAIRQKHKALGLKSLTRKAKLGPVPPTKVVVKDR